MSFHQSIDPGSILTVPHFLGRKKARVHAGKRIVGRWPLPLHDRTPHRHDIRAPDRQIERQIARLDALHINTALRNQPQRPAFVLRVTPRDQQRAKGERLRFRPNLRRIRRASRRQGAARPPAPREIPPGQSALDGAGRPGATAPFRHPLKRALKMREQRIVARPLALLRQAVELETERFRMTARKARASVTAMSSVHASPVGVFANGVDGMGKISHNANFRVKRSFACRV
ncbi:hypothetical protein [Acetobacter nitrogenifigens]|uniref:hypothetical protein n=1 Tax=Acetobacter nitrogenifigens TaxID=285268 RepID=UPI0011BFC408|nr:hypothetical protein [Acetobacter nitrogenifigens]